MSGVDADVVVGVDADVVVGADVDDIANVVVSGELVGTYSAVVGVLAFISKREN